MVIADQRSPSPTENFVLFPFTHPALRKSEPCLPLEISTTRNMLVNDVSAAATHKASTVESRLRSSVASKVPSYGTTSSKNEADFGRRGGSQENAKNGEYPLDEDNETDEFLDFARQHLNTFDDPRSTHNVVSRESMLVQVGQPDIEVEDCLDKVEDVSTEMADTSGDTVFGPAFGELEAVDETPPRAPVNETASNGYILMMETKLGMNRTQFQNQQRAVMLFNARNVPFKTLDGSDPTNKDIRNELFKLSDMRGAYPQFFVVCSDENEHATTTFLGDWETIEGINDSSSLPAELLEANPTLLTWGRIPGLSFKLE